MMPDRLRHAAWFSLAALVAASPLAAQDTFDWSGTLASGQTFEVRGISGEVVATRGSGTQAVVRAVKTGRDSDFDGVQIVVDASSDGIVVCALYGRVATQSCDGDGARDEEWEDRSINVSVDFEIAVPAGVDLDVSMVSGEVRAEGLGSDVEISTVSGDVFVSTSGVVQAQSVSGDLEVTMGGDNVRDLDFSTVSGDITVSLPSGIDADVRFESLSGDFDVDLAMTVERRSGRIVGSSLNGRLGQGGPNLSFKTVSGDVTVRGS